MLDFLKREANHTTTENGAKAYLTSNNYCVDLFGSIGALRSAHEEDIISRFIKAYNESPDTAMKILFYARDVRSGLGERRIFRILINYLARFNSDSIIKNIKNIAEYGRFDDLISLLNTQCEKNVIEFISKQLREDIKDMEYNHEVSLLAKWLPSLNASNKTTISNAKRICRLLNMTYENYRKTLSSLRKYINIIENPLREKDYTFDYTKQPSKALFKYRRAFIRNDNERYLQFIQKAKTGEVVLKTSSLYPYDIVRDCRTGNKSRTEKEVLDVTWNSFPNYCDSENAIAVVDGSGSMYGFGNPAPIEVAISLGIYFAEKNQGVFHNHFITFSTKPRLIEIKGENIVDKIHYCMGFNEVSNTNLQKVFELILNTALKNKIQQSELPSTIYIISDMEFDSCTENPNQTLFEYAKNEYDKYGYKLPNIVFWNVQSRQQQVPVKFNDLGVALVSGASPKIFNMVISNELDPYKYMMKILSQDRYNNIMA